MPEEKSWMERYRRRAEQTGGGPDRYWAGYESRTPYRGRSKNRRRQREGSALQDQLGY